MITRPLKIITLAALGASLATGAAAQTITSVRTDAPPVIDATTDPEQNAG